VIGILKFKLPEEQDEFKLAQDAPSYLSALNDFHHYLRSLRKHSDVSNKKPEELLEEIWEKFHAILNENEVDI